MMAFGLQSHIWDNNVKSALLLAGFPIVLCLFFYGICLLIIGIIGDFETVNEATMRAAVWFNKGWPFAFVAAIFWFMIAMVSHESMINGAARSRGLVRSDAPEVYNLLENLCISRGLPVPKLNIIETSALNAFASGLDNRTYTITLTRGLIRELNTRELRAVIAHELTHIVNKDVRLLIISVIFVGIFSFAGQVFYQSIFRTGGRISGYSSGRSGDSRGAGMVILIAVALIVMAYVLAIFIRFTLSRKREYLADAGAVDLTRDSSAMISALRKISGRAYFDIPRDAAQMCIENKSPFAGVFATHPPIEKRILALQKYAGG